MKNVLTNLNNLKNTVDELDVDKLVPVPVDLSNLSDVVKNDVVKKDVYNATNKNIEDTMPDATMPKNFTARLAKANLVSINDIANFVKKTDFDNKLINLNKTVTSNKNELNEPSEKVKSISTKGLTKYLINIFSILNVAKDISSQIFKIA